MQKLLVGLKNIHRADLKDGVYETPVPIKYAKKISNKLNFESTQEWADDTIVEDSANYAGGEGTITTLGLLADEYNLLFGSELMKGGVVVSESDVAPSGAWLFEKQKKKSNHKRLYAIYNATCQPIDINAETIVEGKAEAEETEINYTVGSYTHTNGKTYIYAFIDTDDPTVDAEQITNWYKEVQFPIARTVTPPENKMLKK